MKGYIIGFKYVMQGATLTGSEGVEGKNMAEAFSVLKDRLMEQKKELIEVIAVWQDS